MRSPSWRGLAPLLALVIGSCAPPPRAATTDVPIVRPSPPLATPSGRASERAADAVVVVTLDGARWQDVFDRANMPYLADVARTRGAAFGAPGFGEIRASGPNFVSLPGYTELFTGRASHGCRDNDCPRVSIPTLADEVAAHGDGAAVFASWECIDRAATASAGQGQGVVVSAGQDGERMAPWPGDGEFRPDRFTARAALSYLEHRRPSFLFLGLGEPDELAHRGDLPGYLGSLRAADAVVADLFTVLARMGERGVRTAVFITADHGRAQDFRNHGGAYPESARVWLVAAGAGIRARGAATAMGVRHLADVAPTARALLGLPRDVAAGAGAPLAELLLDAE